MRQSLIVWACVMCVGGCHKSSSDPRISVGKGVGSDTASSNIITRPIGEFVSVLVGEGIEVQGVKERRTEAGFLEVQVDGYNHAQFKKRFDYRVEWLDADGMLIGSVMTAWITKTVPAKSAFSFQVVAGNPRAVNYRINTRPDTNVD